MSRVNGSASGQLQADLAAVVCPELDAVVLPKLESPAELAELDVLLLSELEEERGVPRGSIRIVGLIETARGLARVVDIAFGAPGRLLTFAFGLVDFAAGMSVLSRAATATGSCTPPRGSWSQPAPSVAGGRWMGPTWTSTVSRGLRRTAAARGDSDWADGS